MLYVSAFDMSMLVMNVFKHEILLLTLLSKPWGYTCALSRRVRNILKSHLSRSAKMFSIRRPLFKLNYLYNQWRYKKPTYILWKFRKLAKIGGFAANFSRSGSPSNKSCGLKYTFLTYDTYQGENGPRIPSRCLGRGQIKVSNDQVLSLCLTTCLICSMNYTWRSQVIFKLSTVLHV